MSFKKNKDDRPTKRASTRTIVVSKSMRFVDLETRKEVRDKRLQKLDADNYIEDQEAGQEDDAYADSDSDRPIAKKSKTKSKGKGGSMVDKWAARRPKSMDKIIEEQLLESHGTATNLHPTSVNYISIAAGPSWRPARHYCSVCGSLGSYTCTRCGMRFCSIRCNENHKETRCLTFAM